MGRPGPRHRDWEADGIDLDLIQAQPPGFTSGVVPENSFTPQDMSLQAIQLATRRRSREALGASHKVSGRYEWTRSRGSSLQETRCTIISGKICHVAVDQIIPDELWKSEMTIGSSRVVHAVVW